MISKRYKLDRYVRLECRLKVWAKDTNVNYFFIVGNYKMKR